MKQFALPEGYENIPTLIDRLRHEPEEDWIEAGQQRALRLFHAMATRVPAYVHFLQKNGIKPASVKTMADFSQLPTLDKDNYLRAYPREQLCWDGKFKQSSWVISATSGSTGEPYYFPRQDAQDDQYALLAEMYLRTNFKIHERSTLYVVAFPMGAWIGGLFTYEALKHVAARGYNLSIITPGIHKAEVIKAVKNLGADFDQVIIGAYGPFLKDILDDGIAEGLDWKKYKTKFVLSAEAFSETFRDHLAEKAGLENILTDTLNHYGTVDLGTMSYETPVAIMLRRLGIADRQLYQGLFGEVAKLPTLTQFIPELFYFESVNGSLLCSAYSGLPLVRYDLKDNGGVFTFAEVSERFSRLGVDIKKEAAIAGITETVWNLPFVYVYERADFSVSFFAFQIYPETIRKALHDRSLFDDVTSKFTMLVEYDKTGQQRFIVHVELRAGRTDSPELKQHVTDLIMDRLLKDSSEYREVHKTYPHQVVPQVEFWPYEHPDYFKPGTKQKWVKK